MGATLFQILCVVLVLVATCCGQECDPNDVKCSGGVPTGPILSCANGVDCGDESMLELCRTKMNCYALTECTESGIFPDPTMESNYFVCLPDSISGGFIKYDFSCPAGEYFDQTILMCLSSAATGETTLPPTTEPTTPLPETTTPEPTTPPLFACTAPGIFPDPNNCKMYFRCSTSLKAFPYICPGRSYFNEITMKCSLVITPGCQEQILENATVSTTTVSTAAPEPVPTTTSIPTATTLGPFACAAPGIFPNPTNCKMYFHCSTSLKAFHYMCPGRSYFNEVIRKCSMIITPTCQEQILKNSTTTPTPTTITTPTTPPTAPTTPTTPPTAPTTPTTPPTEPTTPTTPPTEPTTPTTPPTEPTTPTTPPTAPTTPTTSPSAPTTPTTPPTEPTTPTTPPATEPPTPFSCPSAGTFENPTNCKTYYRCSSTRAAFLYTCPGTSYFNEVTKRCAMSITPRCRSKLLA